MKAATFVAIATLRLVTGLSPAWKGWNLRGKLVSTEDGKESMAVNGEEEGSEIIWEIHYKGNLNLIGSCLEDFTKLCGHLPDCYSSLESCSLVIESLQMPLY